MASSERILQETAQNWVGDSEAAVREAAVWAARAEDTLFEAMGNAEADPTTTSAAGRKVTRQLMLADTMANVSRAIMAVAQVTATAAVAREVKGNNS